MILLVGRTERPDSPLSGAICFIKDRIDRESRRRGQINTGFMAVGRIPSTIRLPAHGQTRACRSADRVHPLRDQDTQRGQAEFARSRKKTGGLAPKGGTVYSIDIASDGHSSTQVSQSTQRSVSILALPSSMTMADAGQTSTQVSQAVHFSISTTAGTLSPPNVHYEYVNIIYKGIKNKFRFPRRGWKRCS